MITDWRVLLEGFSGFEISLMVVNAILLLISYPLFNKLSHGHMEEKKTRLRLNVFRSINALIIALLGSLQVLELNSLLQAGGVIGFVGVLMALTQASWAPDIISGLIILNSDLLEEGDVVQLEGMDSDLIGMIFKTKMFHTEILNIVNNHRIMIRNAKLRDIAIHNLSKFASARGLREVLVFNIGYEHDAETVKKMFNEVFERVVESRTDIDIDHQHPIEVRADSADNYAVKWKVFYYTKNLRRLLHTRQELLEEILQSAKAKGISLATPLMHQETRSMLSKGGAPDSHSDTASLLNQDS